ncbi:MAG: RHS repeat-associated core domain-containing protein [Deltaproteobacteria bacterium]|nr:RHS repeat-associated core domain-containing protein [Deltaproteobacteria bacterium]
MIQQRAINKIQNTSLPHHLIGKTYPLSKTVTYTYDKLNRISTVTNNWSNQTATYAHDSAGRMTSFKNFNGITTTYKYDNANRLTNINIPNIASYAFTTIDANGNRTNTTQTEPFTATSLAQGNTAYTYNTQKNRLLTVGWAAPTTFTYDNEGQLSSGYANLYGFDYEHRLTGTSTDTYYYDGAGRRLQATRSGVITRYIYDAAGNLLAETDGSNNITKYYIYGGAGLLAMVTPANQTYCYHFNAVGNTIAMTDINKTIVNKYSYDPFGNILNEQETITQPFKFVGQFGVMTESNGFYYMRARYYDPNTGRFISEDPLGFGGGDVNLMGYVFNNPVNLVDADGRCPVCFVLAYTGAQAGAVAVAYAGTKIAQWATNYLAGSNAVSNQVVNDAFTQVGAVTAGGVGVAGLASTGTIGLSVATKTFTQTGDFGFYGSVALGAAGSVLARPLGPAGSFVFGMAGSYAGGVLGGYLDAPNAGQPNYNEPTVPLSNSKQSKF